MLDEVKTLDLMYARGKPVASLDGLRNFTGQVVLASSGSLNTRYVSDFNEVLL